MSKQNIPDKNDWIQKLSNTIKIGINQKNNSQSDTTVKDSESDLSKVYEHDSENSENEIQIKSELSFLQEDKKKNAQQQIYKKIVDAFINQEDKELVKNEKQDEFNELMFDKDRFKQSKIIKENRKEFEKLFHLSKLEVVNNPVLEVIEMNEFDRIEQFIPSTLFEKIFKRIWYIKVVLSQNALKIVTNPIFTFITLIVITFNSIMLAFNDPTTNHDDNEDIDFALLIIYTIEMVLKILSFGFIFNKNAYLRDGWNIIDLIIIISGYLPYFINSESLNLSSLRSLRVLRPLRSISKIKILNKLLNALFSAIPLLKDALIILAFFYVIFGIGALQLFSGQLKNRCIESSTGILYGDNLYNIYLCSQDIDCTMGSNSDISYICSKGMVSPNYDIINFDSFGWSVLNIFVIVSNEGWTNIMYLVQHAFSVRFYFISDFGLLNQIMVGNNI